MSFIANEKYFYENTSNLFRRFFGLICLFFFSFSFSQNTDADYSSDLFVVGDAAVIYIAEGATIYQSEKNGAKIASASTRSTQQPEKRKSKESSLPKVSGKLAKSKEIEIPVSKNKPAIFSDLSDSEEKFSQLGKARNIVFSAPNSKNKFFLNENFPFEVVLIQTGKIKIYSFDCEKDFNRDHFSFSIRPPPIS